jgi:predicted DNA-binding antitoxin AbrB/MazE fold protein
MAQSVIAVYEKGVLIPESQLELPEHARVELTIKPCKPQSVAEQMAGTINIDEKVAIAIVENEDLIGVE